MLVPNRGREASTVGEDATMARLTGEARRTQLLDLGALMIAEVGFDRFSIDDLATRADVSRSLLFHYFPTRQDFLVAVARRAAEEVLEVTEPAAGLPAAVALVAAIEGFLDHLERWGEQYVALVRGAAGGDARMQEVFQDTRAALARRIVDRLGALGDRPGLVHLAARGQIALAEEVITAWLVAPRRSRVSREELVAFLASSVVDGLLRAGVPLDDDTRALLPSR